jgi:hypothetical protein
LGISLTTSNTSLKKVDCGLVDVAMFNTIDTAVNIAYNGRI